VARNKKKSTPEKQALILWALLVREGAAAFQNELRPEPEKADRDALAAAGLIKHETRERRIWIEVTDRGWEWAGRNLGAALPTNSSAGCQILQAWLTRLQAFMGARNLVLADVLGPQSADHAQPWSSAGTIAHSPSTPVDYTTARKRIRKAYLDLTGGRFNTRALLSDIREKLKDIDRATLDEALKTLHGHEGATLMRMDDPRQIDARLRGAELTITGEPMHILWISR
jgi:hypothetical protein